MADLDTELSARLSRLAAAVPVAPGQLDVVQREAVRARQQVRMAWLTPLVVLVVGVVAASALRVGPFAPGATPQPSGPVTATTTDGDFTLSMTASKGTYLDGEPIDIGATFAYDGGESTVISHYTGGRRSPVLFGIVEPIFGGAKLEPSWGLGCTPTTILRGRPLEVPFEKVPSPLFDAATSDIALWLEDPELRLPPGIWHIFAKAVFQPHDCLDLYRPPDPIEMRVELEITVLPRPGETPLPSVANPPQPTTAPLPSDPVVDTETEGPFSLELRSARAVYLENEPIDVAGTFTYSGSEEISVRSDSFFPLAFGIREPVYGLTIFGVHAIPLVGYIGCPPPTVIRPGEQYHSTFVISGVSPSPASAESTQQQRAFLADPELRLPPGTWHFAVRSDLMVEACVAERPTTERPAVTTTLSAEIEILVLPAAEPSGPSAAEATTEPTTEAPIRPTPAPAPDGSPIDVETDGVFELRLDPASRVYRTDEPIILNTSYSYVGPDLNVVVGHFVPEVGFSIEQLDDNGNADGDIVWAKVYDSSCTGRSLRSGIAVPIAMADENLMGLRATSLPGGFHADLDGGILRLLPGRYRVTASLSTHLGGCRDGQPDPGTAHGLGVEVEIVVVPSTWSRVPILTASEPASACHLARHEGRIAPNDDSGIGTAGADGTRFSVRWPYGWSGWRNASGVVLLDSTGAVVASEGDTVVMGGGGGVGVDFYACSGIEVTPSQ